MSAPASPSRALTAEEAAARVAGLPRPALLRRAASALATALRREGEPGAAIPNRNALSIAAACLALLLRKGAP
ncbi:MAG: hypothetical protein K2X11_02550 [Acetobacteraceae bacterium]|nr:hypothetical protein [Acetobacteraceae bacterium]